MHVQLIRDLAPATGCRSRGEDVEDAKHQRRLAGVHDPYISKLLGLVSHLPPRVQRGGVIGFRFRIRVQFRFRWTRLGVGVSGYLVGVLDILSGLAFGLFRLKCPGVVSSGAIAGSDQRSNQL